MSDSEFVQLFSAGTDELPADVLAELESVARIHGLSAEDLYFKWESHCIERDMAATDLTMATVRAFKQVLQDRLERISRQQQHLQLQSQLQTHHGRQGGGMRPARAAAAGGGDVFGMLDGLATPITPSARAERRRRPYETPTVSRVRAEVASSSPASVGDHLDAMGTLPPSAFADRIRQGEVVECLNEHLAAAPPPAAPPSEPRVRLKASTDRSRLAYKTLAMKLSETSDALDDRIDDFAELVREHHSLDPADFGNPATQGVAPVYAVGRIASDSAAAGRLNRASVVLETSRRVGDGRRVPLNLGRSSLARGGSVFPGQIVAVRGINSAGYEFVVDEMLELPLLPQAGSTPEAIGAVRDLLRGKGRQEPDGTEAAPDAMDVDGGGDDGTMATEPAPLAVFVAAGPYTADDNLDFEPLQELCARAAEARADLVILAGPFLDADHPMIATGDFDLPDGAECGPDTATLATAFKYLFTPALHRLAHTVPSATIMLVLSVRDVIAKHIAWPQDAPPARGLGLPPRVRLLNNPVTVSANEAVLAVSSHDALFELKAEELLVAGARPSDSVGRLVRHLLEQRHHYPVFPPMDRTRLPKTGTPGGVATGAMLDVGHLQLGEMVGVRPDIMVTPSSLPPFARVVENVVVINPGMLSKRRGAGTYARMTLHAPAPDGGPHRVHEQARVEIVRI